MTWWTPLECMQTLRRGVPATAVVAVGTAAVAVAAVAVAVAAPAPAAVDIFNC
jgi:hypothetical protein